MILLFPGEEAVRFLPFLGIKFTSILDINHLGWAYMRRNTYFVYKRRGMLSNANQHFQKNKLLSMLQFDNRSVEYNAKSHQVIDFTQASVWTEGWHHWNTPPPCRRAGRRQDSPQSEETVLRVFFPRVAHSDMGFNFQGEKC